MRVWRRGTGEWGNGIDGGGRGEGARGRATHAVVALRGEGGAEAAEWGEGLEAVGAARLNVNGRMHFRMVIIDLVVFGIVANGKVQVQLRYR